MFTHPHNTLFSALYIQLFYFQGMVLNKLPARLDLFTHQGRKDVIGIFCILNIYLEQGSFVRMHGGFPQLLRIHFPQTFVALQGAALKRLAFRYSQKLLPV